MGSSGNEYPAPKRKQHMFPKENYDSGCYSMIVCSLNVSWLNLAALPTTVSLKPMEAVGHAEPSTSLRHMAASEFTTLPPPKAKKWACCVQTDKALPSSTLHHSSCSHPIHFMSGTCHASISVEGYVMTGLGFQNHMFFADVAQFFSHRVRVTTENMQTQVNMAVFQYTLIWKNRW